MEGSYNSNTDIEPYSAGIDKSNSAGWRCRRREQGQGIMECFHYSAAIEQPGLQVESMKLLEEEMIGVPGLDIQRNTPDYMTIDGPFGRQPITQRQIFDLERPCKTGWGYDLLVRDQRFFNVFYLQEDASSLTLDTEQSTSLSVNLSSTTSTIPVTAPRTVGSSGHTAAIAESLDFPENGTSAASTGTYLTYAGEYAALSPSGSQPNYDMSMSTIAETDFSAGESYYSNTPVALARPIPSYQPNYVDIPKSEVYRPSHSSYYRNFPNDVGTQSQGLHVSPYAGNATTSQQQGTYQDPETNHVYSQRWRDHDRGDRPERQLESKIKSSPKGR